MRIYEKGSDRGSVGSYSRGTSYDFRIASRAGGGATYHVRPSGSGAGFTQVYQSDWYADAEMSIGADVYSGVFGFDDLRVDGAVAWGQDVDVSVPGGGDVILVVQDHALQEDRATVTLQSVTGSPPIAVISAPAEVEVGADVLLDARGSSDDHGVVSYEWDFGDGSGHSGADDSLARHFYGSPGDYTVSLTVLDAAGRWRARPTPSPSSGRAWCRRFRGDSWGTSRSRTRRGRGTRWCSRRSPPTRRCRSR